MSHLKSPAVPVDYYRNVFTGGVQEVQCYGCDAAFESDNIGEMIDLINAHDCAAAEDAADAADAAMADPGDSIPLEDVEAEHDA